MENPNRTNSEKMLTEIFQDTKLLTTQHQPDIDIKDLKLLGIKFNKEFKRINSTKPTSENSQKLVAMKHIYTNLMEAIELADEFGFTNLAKKITEVKVKIDKILLK